MGPYGRGEDCPHDWGDRQMNRNRDSGDEVTLEPVS